MSWGYVFILVLVHRLRWCRLTIVEVVCLHGAFCLKCWWDFTVFFSLCHFKWPTRIFISCRLVLFSLAWLSVAICVCLCVFWWVAVAAIQSSGNRQLSDSAEQLIWETVPDLVSSLSTAQHLSQRVIFIFRSSFYDQQWFLSHTFTLKPLLNG